MSKHTLIKRRKRQDAAWRKFAFYPQRMIIPAGVPAPQRPMRDQIWSVPDPEEPYNRGGVLPFRPRQNPYRGR